MFGCTKSFTERNIDILLNAHLFWWKVIMLDSLFVWTTVFCREKDRHVHQHMELGQAYAVCRFRALPPTSNLVLCRPSSVTPASLVAFPWRIPVRLPPERRQG